METVFEVQAMKKELIVKLHTDFEALRRQAEEIGTEFGLRGTCRPSSDTLSGEFEQVIEKAVISCEKAGQEPGDHFARGAKWSTSAQGLSGNWTTSHCRGTPAT